MTTTRPSTHCANWTNGICSGVNIHDDLSLSVMTDMEGKPCIETRKTQCPYFNACVIPGVHTSQQKCECGKPRRSGHKYCDSCADRAKKDRDRGKKQKRRSLSPFLPPKTPQVS